MRKLAIGLLVGFVAALQSMPREAAACPFCSAVSQTFGQEIEASQVAVFAKLIAPPPKLITMAEDPTRIDFNQAPPKAKFEIVDVLKGGNLLSEQKQIDVLYFGESAVGTQFLILGIEPPSVVWATPIELSETARKYVSQVVKLPKEGADRLAFFQDYLEHSEDMLARDAYDEFARSPYAAVKALNDRMKHDRLIAWIWDTQVPASRKRLYLTMLSVCGTERDLLMLETIFKAEDRQVKLGLDAAIACYLTLKGPDGLALIEDLYFKKSGVEYTDTHAAIMALRFHAQEGDVIPKDRIKLAFRHMLEQPKLADLIIPDLARLQDWEVVDRMVALFKEADAESSWVRVPVINYLRACPLPEAKKHVEELAKIDPEAVQQASAFFPLNSAPAEAASRDGNSAAAPVGDAAAIPMPMPKANSAEAAKPPMPTEDERAGSTPALPAAYGQSPPSAPGGGETALNSTISQTTSATSASGGESASASAAAATSAPEATGIPAWQLLLAALVIGSLVLLLIVGLSRGARRAPAA